MKNNNETIAKNSINSIRTKYGEKGFTNNELIKLVKFIKKDNPYFSDKMMQEALFGNTCAVINNEIVNYTYDVYKAIICGLEHRSLTVDEWD